MSIYTLERKLAAPVYCMTCNWLGKCGDLKTRLACPKCGDDTNIKWIENNPPAKLQ